MTVTTGTLRAVIKENKTKQKNVCRAEAGRAYLNFKHDLIGVLFSSQQGAGLNKYATVGPITQLKLEWGDVLRLPISLLEFQRAKSPDRRPSAFRCGISSVKSEMP